MKPITLIVKKSTISGKGLFALTAIPANAIMLLAFNIISPDQWKESEPVNFINHSDQNNLSNFKIGNRIYKYTNRDIAPGEELTTNYLDLAQFNPPFRTDLVFKRDPFFYQEIWTAYHEAMPKGYTRPIGTKYNIIKITKIK